MCPTLAQLLKVGSQHGIRLLGNAHQEFMRGKDPIGCLRKLDAGITAKTTEILRSNDIQSGPSPVAEVSSAAAAWRWPRKGTADSGKVHIIPWQVVTISY